MSRLSVWLIAASIAVAGPTAAQGYGTFAPNKPRSGWPGAPAPKPAPSFVGATLPSTTYAPTTATRPSYGTPPASSTPPAFKPYEAWKPNTSTTSLFGPDGRRKH